nr:VanZ family protein [uncultured Allomuricauda sp.]
MMCITSLSLFSFSDLDTGSVNIPYADKIVHFSFYFGFVVLGYLSLRERKPMSPLRYVSVLILVIQAVLFGIGIEGLQHILTENRMAEYGDAFANAVGACFGGLAIGWYFSKREPLK